MGRSGAHSSPAAVYTSTLVLTMLSIAADHPEMILILTQARGLSLVIQELRGNRGDVRNPIVSSVAAPVSVGSAKVGV